MNEFCFKIVFPDGRKKMTNQYYDVYWFKNDVRHRENNLPAYIGFSGFTVWYKNGLRVQKNTTL